MSEKITKQTGLDGFKAWLNAQPGVPEPGPLYDPANVSTWKWDDKLARTLGLLAADHDELLDRVAALEAAKPSPLFFP